ncbi:MAG: glycosyltransferase family 39 protein [Candidatus Moraniibacteriota bacterium]
MVLLFMQNFIKKYHIPIFLLILGLGVFLRVYNFSDYLIFKSDQARDALIINGVNLGGFETLPLTGPQIGGMESRLGPFFYYEQFIASKIFGFSPESLAYPDLVFGILAIISFFLLARVFFNLKISLWLATLGSVSLFLVTFSRFAWNPNSLAFFTSAFAYLFLSALGKKGLKRELFLFLAFVCFGIIAQLHLFAILSLGLGLFLFLLVTRTLNWRELLMGFLVVLVLHTPLLISEFGTGGKNSSFFSKTVIEKREKESEHLVFENILRAYQENSRALWITVTGKQNLNIISTKSTKLICNEECKNSLIYLLAAMILMGWMMWSIFNNWKREEKITRKNALAFLGLWWLSFLIFSGLLAYQMEIRFYLGLVPLFLISLGFVLKDVLAISRHKLFRYFIWSICWLVIFLNLQATSKYLKELSVSRTSNFESSDDLRFGSDAKVTLGQLRDIASEASTRLDKESFLVISGETHYVKALYYLLTVEHGYRGCYLRGRNADIDTTFNQLVIGYNKSDGSVKYFLDNSDSQKEFGTLGASFKKSNIYADSPFPVGCINY